MQHLRSLPRLVALALTAALVATGCSTSDDSGPVSQQSSTGQKLTGQSTEGQLGSAGAEEIGPESGLPLDQVDDERPGNSEDTKSPSMGVYKREGGICPVRGDEADCHRVPMPYRLDAEALWQRTLLFFPPEVRKGMTTFVLMPRGQGGGVADSPNGKYNFSLAFPTTGNVDQIIIHELGHGFEVSTQKEFAKKWRQRFWTAADLTASDAHFAKNGAKVEDNPVFTESPDRFVHPYGASNASEDFAETFRYFVLGVKPTGDSIKEQKILMMWDAPELVAARANIQEQRLAHPGPLEPVAADN